jgi:hypothetical protein
MLAFRSLPFALLLLVACSGSSTGGSSDGGDAGGSDGSTSGSTSSGQPGDPACSSLPNRFTINIDAPDRCILGKQEGKTYYACLGMYAERVEGRAQEGNFLGMSKGRWAALTNRAVAAGKCDTYSFGDAFEVQPAISVGNGRYPADPNPNAYLAPGTWKWRLQGGGLDCGPLPANGVPVVPADDDSTVLGYAVGTVTVECGGSKSVGSGSASCKAPGPYACQ